MESWLASTPVELLCSLCLLCVVVLGLLLGAFFLLQVVDITMKEGVRAGVTLTFTSFFVFPAACILEILEVIAVLISFSC